METKALDAMKPAIVVTGGTAGLGDLLVRQLALTDLDIHIVRIGRGPIPERTATRMANWPRAVFDLQMDLSNPAQIGTIDMVLRRANLRCDVLINNAGQNHIQRFEDTSTTTLETLMQVNALSNVQLVQMLIPHLAHRKGLVVNVVSNASHQPMSYSIAYNMSKAAQAMATKQMARELHKRFGITVMSVSPNKLAGTEMSGYIDRQAAAVNGKTVEEMKQYQLNGLASGKETDPQVVAEVIASIVENENMWQYLNGSDWEVGK